MLHIVGGRELLVYLFVHENKGATMFASSHFGVAQSPCNGLCCPTSFGRVGVATLQCATRNQDCQSLALMWYVPHYALHYSKTLLCTFSFCPSVWGKEWSILSNRCELHLTLGGKSSFYLVDSYNFVPSKTQSLVTMA